MTLLLQERPRAAHREAAIHSRHLPSSRRGEIHEREFSGMVGSLTGRLTAFARRIVDDEELAQDAVQEALLSFWLEAERPPNPTAWLLRAVRNRCLHQCRGRARRLKHEAKARQDHTEASRRDDPAERLEREELARIFTRALDRLADDQRTILALSLIDELDYQSIAIVLEIPVGTVRSRLSRARQALRVILAGLLPELDDARHGSSAADRRQRSSGPSRLSIPA